MKINHYVAALDACVLAPMPVADTLLRLAEEIFYTPKWSDEILRQTKRTIEKFGYSPEQSQRRINAMMNAFPEAMIEGYAELIPAMRNHEKDRHVLAAAVRANAHCIVSDNRKHFPAEALGPYDVECLTADEFLTHQYHLNTDGFITILRTQAEETNRSISDLIATLGKYVPQVSSLFKP